MTAASGATDLGNVKLVDVRPKGTQLKKSLILIAVLIGALLPADTAIAAPDIDFLNPSAYTTAQVISDKDDTGDHFHLVAWVKEVPANPIVEFELSPPGGVALNTVTVTASRVGNDTWEHFFEVPDNMPDAEGYTLRAILYSGNDQVSVEEQIVRVNHQPVPPPDAENTVEIVEPTNGSQNGFFTPPAADGKPNTVIDVVASEGTRQARGFYTVTAPGNEPVWNECGTVRITDGRGRIRCVLETEKPAQVTALAAVANNTPPPGPPQEVADGSGDAHRIVPYEQLATSVQVDPNSKRVDVGACSELVATVLDQLGDEMSNVNVDVHATGPDDQLQFGTLFDDTFQQTSDEWQPPDKGAHATESGIDCTDQTALNKQGDHNRPSLSDIKHVESVDNTNNAGEFGFTLYSGTRGGTQITAWADSNNDDIQGPAEAAGGSVLGWGESPPPPETQIFLDPTTAQSGTADCQRMVLTVRQGGSPLSGANVDVHAVGPDANVQFCTPSDGTPVRQPDQGEHVGGRDSDGGAHGEGETNSSGQLIFGVASPSQGATDVTGWVDLDDDDVLDGGEPNARGQIAWGGTERQVATSLSMKYRRGAFKGSVRSQEAKCRSGRQVTIKKKVPGRDRVIASDTSNRRGSYSARARAKGRYYATVARKTFVANNGDTVNCQPAKTRTKRF